MFTISFKHLNPNSGVKLKGAETWKTEKTKLFQAPTKPKAPPLSKRGRIISFDG
jgi:hypothetical protein